MNDNSKVEKLALLALAGIATISLTVIGVWVIRSGGVDANGAGLLGVIVGGLIALGKDLVAAVRAYAMSAQLGKVTDQLAASGPLAPPDPDEPPQQVIVANPPSKPVNTKAAKP